MPADVSDSEEFEVEKESQFEADWGHVMAGLDRAVAWIKINKPCLRSGFWLRLSRETGIEIHISTMFANDSELAIVRALFAGKVAERTMSGENERFLVRDAGLRFTWEIYHPKPCREERTEQITL